MLTSPVQEGETLVVVPSRGGDDHHPAWFVNLRGDPEVEVALKGDLRQPMRAMVASAAERARLCVLDRRALTLGRSKRSGWCR
jgi:hypothetical protein